MAVPRLPTAVSTGSEGRGEGVEEVRKERRGGETVCFTE
jgi:hypothetical protein